jgi:hypothetical protein
MTIARSISNRVEGNAWIMITMSMTK